MWLVIFLLIVILENINASSIHYDLRIDQNRHFYETVTYTIEDSSNNYLNSILNNDVYFDLNNTKKYTKKIYKVNNKKLVILKNDYDYSAFSTSRIANNCFDEINYNIDNNQIVFSTFGDYKCNYAKDIKVKITSDIAVITNNADIVNNNEYEWNVDNGFLYIGIRLGEEDPSSGILPPHNDTVVTGNDIGSTYTGIKKYNKWVIIGAVTISIGVLAFGLLILNRNKNKNNNNFYQYIL